jgi:hypothetical protein
MDEEKIRKGIIGTSMIDLRTKIFLSVMGLNEFEDEVYCFGFIDLVSGKIFKIKEYSDPNEAVSKFVDTAFLFIGNKHEIRA